MTDNVISLMDRAADDQLAVLGDRISRLDHQCRSEFSAVAARLMADQGSMAVVVFTAMFDVFLDLSVDHKSRAALVYAADKLAEKMHAANIEGTP